MAICRPSISLGLKSMLLRGANVVCLSFAAGTQVRDSVSVINICFPGFQVTTMSYFCMRRSVGCRRSGVLENPMVSSLWTPEVYDQIHPWLDVRR